MKLIKKGIYKITSPSNKIYIGQSTDIYKRWNDYYKIDCLSQIKLYNSLKKHSPENHKFEIIEECNESLLLERETYWKEYYKVLEIPSLCCRMDGKGGRLGEETKQKISKAKKGHECYKNPKWKENISLSMIGKNKGKIRSNEFKENLSNYRKQFKHTQETKDKISEYHKGRKMSDESKQKISESKIGKKFTQETKDKISKNSKGKTRNNKPIFQYDLEGNFIKEWIGQRKASDELKINQSSIWFVLNNKQKTAGGYVWKYKN